MCVEVGERRGSQMSLFRPAIPRQLLQNNCEYGASCVLCDLLLTLRPLPLALVLMYASSSFVTHTQVLRPRQHH